jgi:DNA-binding CsgD family transcriptional regulator
VKNYTRRLRLLAIHRYRQQLTGVATIAVLTPLCVGPPTSVRALDAVPPRIQPLVATANRGDDIAPIVSALARSFGFDGFMYGVSLSPRPNAENQQYVYLTWSAELVAIYDEKSLIEVDPRIHDVLQTVVPVVWEQATYRGRSVEVDDFLDVLQRFGIASGIVCPIRDMHGRTAMLSLSSAVAAPDEIRRAMIAQALGSVMLFGLYFHELFVRAVINELVPAHLQGAKLSPRERECLVMAAHGLSGEDIAERLAISPRTVQNHFDSIRSKLGAINRLEAVAIAISRGLISI